MRRAQENADTMPLSVAKPHKRTDKLTIETEDEFQPSFLIRILSNPLSALITVAGLVLCLAGFISLGLIISSPDTIDLLIDRSLSQNTALFIGSAMAVSGFGCLLFSDYVSQKVVAEEEEDHSLLFI